MHQPTSKQVELVISNLRTIEKEANKEGMFDIREGNITCGAPACVGGWYTIARIGYRQGNPEYDYISGANMMAEDLGFGNYCDLLDWAHENQEIWGNDSGINMFSHVSAYNDLKIADLPMTCVIEHWEGVRDRLREIENASANV